MQFYSINSRLDNNDVDAHLIGSFENFLLFFEQWNNGINIIVNFHVLCAICFRTNWKYIFFVYVFMQSIQAALIKRLECNFRIMDNLNKKKTHRHHFTANFLSNNILMVNNFSIMAQFFIFRYNRRDDYCSIILIAKGEMIYRREWINENAIKWA